MSQIQSLGLMEQTAFFVSGDQVLDSAVKLINESPDDSQPVKLMLLDNQMPRMTGQQVIAELRCFISARNQERRVKLKEPVFVIVSTYLNSTFKVLLEKEGILAFEKPLQTEELEQILDFAFLK
jgi:CheY-like chemotaxis protein